jgi:dCTP deaminase
VPLIERLALPEDLAATANPKSSTGRLDIFTRVIADGAGGFDRVPAGYRGPLFVEISPRTFPVLVRTGSRLGQLRLRRGETRLSDVELAALHARAPLVEPGEALIDDGLNVSIDLASALAGGRVGYRAKRHTGVIDVDRRDAYEVADFWEPIAASPDRGLILDPNEFYILVSREAVQVPPETAAEMVPFDPLVGEFRVHYAGFFDPGFGHGAEGAGARAVLEVRSREVPFILEHGQVVARLVYERMAALPDRLYGHGIASNYQAQSLKLSKHFRGG